MIFLIATDVPESWSLAELGRQCRPVGRAVDSPHETEGAHADGLEVDIAGRDLEYGAEDGKFDEVGHVRKEMFVTVHD